MDRYSGGAMVFHWTIFLLIAFLGGLGLLFGQIPRPDRPFWINVHACVGLLYLALVVMRVAWRLGHRPPDLPAHVGKLARLASAPVHLLLYVLMLVIPELGIVAYVWHGRVFDFSLFKLNFGVTSAPAVYHPAEDIHGWLAYGLFGLAGFHAAAALWHHFIQRDDVLKRMLPGE